VKTLTGVAVALAVLLSPSAGVAQAPQLPVGEAHGVRVVRDHRHGIVVVLNAKLHKRFAGKNVIVSCTTLLKDGSGSGSQRMEVPLHSRRLVTGDVTPNIDYCRVWRPRIRHTPKRVLVSVPLTQKGAVFIDEETKTRSLLGVAAIAEFAQVGKNAVEGYPTYDELIASLPKRARPIFSKRVVALAAPTDAPPPHKVGYYSDGGESVAVAIVSASGRLLFIRFGPDETFSTNVVEYIFNERD
jgi:hypothetical protein